MRSEAGRLVAEARHRARLRQSELAERAGVAQSMVSAYETGVREPTLPTLHRLLAAAGFTLSLGLERSDRLSRAFSGPVGRRVVEHRSALTSVLRTHGITGTRVFGSTARGDDRPDSDIDLLVALPPGLGLFALASLKRELEAIVGAPVDLVPEDGLKDHVRRAVESELVPL